MAKIKTEEELLGLAQQLHVQPFIPSGAFCVPKTEITDLLPADLAWGYDMAVIGSAGREVTIVLDYPENPRKDEVINMIQKKGFMVAFYLTTSEHLANLRKVVHPKERVELEPKP
jgi:hypothetical protein